MLALFAGEASAQKLRQPSAGTALKTLVRQTNALPRSAASRATKLRLLRAARSARRSAKRRPCSSVRQLARYRRVLRGIRLKKGPSNLRARNRLTDLGPASMNATRALLASKLTRRCGGGVKPSKLEEARMTVLKSDANGMRIRVRLPALRFVDAEGGGRTWTKLMLPKTDAPGAPGTPGIPMVSNTIGVPEGAALDVEATKTTSYTIDSVDVFPNQPEPVDQGPSQVTEPPDLHAPPYSQPPFEIDRSAYAQRGMVPAQAADGAVLGRSRDLTIGNLRVPAAQYNPAKKELEVLNTVDVTVRFEGGSHQFSDQLGSPWEHAQRTLAASLLNANVVRVPPIRIFERCGEEMLVITNPSTLDAANQFATARRAAGLRVSVFQTGTGPGQIGTTTGEIQTFIRGRLTAEGCIHPSYVTILGDDELVPTFPGIGGIESDLEYSLRDNADEFADVALGRILGDDAAGVTTAVTKIVNYENGPPGGPWLQHATIAAEFQDDEAPNQAEDRTFILFGELSRNGILDTGFSLPQQVDRIYATYPPGAVDPLTFRDGTPLPPELLRPAFAWDGDTADITAAWNDGRYLMIHRDHGWTDGWDNPRFDSDNANALTNGAQLPVVLSINCSSGAFQDDDTSFATQALVNPNGGAAGVFGDTEISPTDHNTQLALGFLDALLPRVLAGEGPADRQRVGSALMHGKARLASIWPPSGPGITGGDGGTRNEFYLWHYFGDPSMQMWGGEPLEPPDVSRFKAVFRQEIGPPPPDPPPYWVEVTLPTEFEGQPISLLRNGQVIGKAVVTNGLAQIPAHFGDGQPKQDGLRVAMEADGRTPVSVPVDGVPPTQLSISCPSGVGWDAPATTGGRIDSDLAGATIELTYTRPGGRGSFQRTATANSSGEWSHTIDTKADDPNAGKSGGTWTVSARYAGDSDHAASETVSCTFTEADG